MSVQPNSSLALALAALEGAMAPATRGAGSPEQRRVAHRLGELIRSEEADHAAFARRHLPGREVAPEALVCAREGLLAFDRLLALLGRGVDAASALNEVHALLERHLKELESHAAELPGPRVDSGAESPGPAVSVVMETASTPFPAAAPPLGTAKLADAELPHPAMAYVPHNGPGQPTVSDVTRPDSTAAPEVAAANEEPPHRSYDALDAMTRVAPIPSAATSAGSPSTGEFAALPFPSSRANVLPFTGKAAARPVNASPPELQSSALPFRRSSMSLSSPLPEHLRELDLGSYATYRVLAELYPDRRGELFAHYRIPDEATADLLDAYFRVRMSSVPGLQAEWETLYARAFAYYRGG
jgi:hypothetical protein